MANRALHLLEVLQSLAQAIEDSIGIASHWDGQNAPPPLTGAYAHLTILRLGWAQPPGRQDVETVATATITVPAILPAVGTELWVFPERLPRVAHTVAVGDTPTIVRDSLLAGLQVHPASTPSGGAGLWSAAAGVGDSIDLTALELGGLGVNPETPSPPADPNPSLLSVYGGLTLTTTSAEASRVQGPARLGVRVAIRGESRAGSGELTSAPVFGDRAPASLWATLAADLEGESLPQTLLNSGIALWGLPPTGFGVDVLLPEGTEPQHVADLDLACKLVRYGAPRIAATEIRATLRAVSQPGSEITETVTVAAP